MTRSSLNAQIIEAERQYQRLGELMAELNAAQRHGNLARIGNAAHEAGMAAIDVDSAASLVFSTVAELDSADWDAAHGYAA